MISRETRRLLITVIVAIAALWVLARIRFQERPAAATPVPNMLAQLRPASSYEDLARLIADIRPAILAAVSPSAGAPALRVREDAAVTLRPAAADTIVATNRATGLSIVRRPRADMPGVMPWVPRLLDYPRYLVVVEVTGEHVALRPVFVGGLYPVTSPLWSGEIWLLPPNTAIPPGTFVFTTEGALAGLSVAHGGQAAIVPAALLTDAVAELQRPRGSAGELGITVEPLSPAFASATGGAVGLVVTAIDPKGPAAGKLVATEVIEAINGEEMRTADHWRARVARVSAGDALTLRVRGADGVRDVPIIAAAPTPADAPAGEPDDVSLGLRLRAVRGEGVDVLSVQPRSRAARAGIQQGDRITAAAGQPSPTPAVLTRLFASLPEGGSLLVAITRGSEHRVAAIEK